MKENYKAKLLFFPRLSIAIHLYINCLNNSAAMNSKLLNDFQTFHQFLLSDVHSFKKKITKKIKKKSNILFKDRTIIAVINVI